jgi:hypothetical protein
MSKEHHLVTKSIHAISRNRLMLIGAVIGLAIISFFLYSGGSGKPEWGPYWRIRPLLVTPFAGAMGGLVYYYLDYFRIQGGWKKLFANVLSFVIFFIGLWMGIVLGLAGTLWD